MITASRRIVFKTKPHLPPSTNKTCAAMDLKLAVEEYFYSYKPLKLTLVLLFLSPACHSFYHFSKSFNFSRFFPILDFHCLSIYNLLLFNFSLVSLLTSDAYLGLCLVLICTETTQNLRILFPFNCC